MGKGTVKLRSENATAEDVLLIENMNHNLLSVSQMCDQGCTILFNSWKYEISREKSGRLVVTATRTPNDIYTLDEIGKEGYFLAKEDESWLWQRRDGTYKL